jgi:peptidoglycan hydrolase-like protein with peptidoglycan-binding domain
MGFISDTARKIVFWNYSRTSWQWDVLCVLILAFIFLTPKSWFASNPPVQTAVQTAVVLSADLVNGQGDNAEIAQRAKQQLNRANGQVVGKVRPRLDSSGKVIAYEVDIR